MFYFRFTLTCLRHVFVVTFKITQARAENRTIKMYYIIYSFTTAMGAGLLILMLFWILHYGGGFAWHSDPILKFNWHPFLMLLGMVFLYAQAILIYRTGRNLPTMKLKLIHAGVHLSAFISCVIGLKAVFSSHDPVNKPISNLSSLHSWIGLTTIILYTIQFMLGFIAFLYPGLSPTIIDTYYPVHVTVGVSAFVMGIISATTGVTEKAAWTLGNKYQEFVPETYVFNFIGIILTIYGILVVYLVTESPFMRPYVPED